MSTKETKLHKAAEKVFTLWRHFSSQEMYGEMLSEGMGKDDYVELEEAFTVLNKILSKQSVVVDEKHEHLRSEYAILKAQHEQISDICFERTVALEHVLDLIDLLVPDAAIKKMLKYVADPKTALRR